jgi:hypothetical protein
MFDVDVSINDKMVTLHSFTDLSVSLPLHGFVAATAQMLFPLQVYVYVSMERLDA